jgi:hypothetical protein
MSALNSEFKISEDARFYEAIPVVPVEYNERVVNPEFAHLYALGEDIERTRANANLSQIVPERQHGFRAAIVALIGMQFPKSAKDFDVRDLIEVESRIGGEIVDNNHAVEERRFFYEKDHNWFYIQIFKDSRGVETIHGTRYEVNDDHVLRIVNGAEHAPIEPDEMQRFSAATVEYHKRIVREVYQQEPANLDPRIVFAVTDKIGKSDYGLAA